MSAAPTRTCHRCHTKKIKCSGFPSCRSCVRNKADCEPHVRPRKADMVEELRQAKRRVKWLEQELFEKFHVDCQGIPTGLSLEIPTTAVDVCSTVHNSNPVDATTQTPVAEFDPQDVVAAAAAAAAVTSTEVSPEIKCPETPQPELNDAPEISLLALNATGEAKYLGPSSGAFFASYATRLARSLLASDQVAGQNPEDGLGSQKHEGALPFSSPSHHEEALPALSPAHVCLLFQSYQMWVQPLYPLLERETLDRLAANYQQQQPVLTDSTADTLTSHAELAVLYLVLALGAINYASTIKQLLDSKRLSASEYREAASQMGKPHALSQLFYARALHEFDCIVQRHGMVSTLATIQVVLLISIYSSYGPIGSSQWQLAGLAMRMAIEIGLHYEPPASSGRYDDTLRDERRRVFWTAYAVEISLAYNLGRPPSIGEEHITVHLPQRTSETALGIHHVRHRQIQSRIVAQVYSASASQKQAGETDKDGILARLQAELDFWMEELPDVLLLSSSSAYTEENTHSYPLRYWERLYHGTSFVLHRASPLRPQPSATSAERCIRSAGACIDCMVDVVRHSNVPLCWMLVQGVLFAGLTMLITTRTALTMLASRERLSGGGGGAATGSQNLLLLLLVDLSRWTRKCSVCLAVVNERWHEELLSQLEAQFEALASDTLSRVSSSVATDGPAIVGAEPNGSMQTQQLAQENVSLMDLDLSSGGIVGNAAPATMATDDWESMQEFREFLGIDDVQTFWDIFGPSEEMDRLGLDIPLDSHGLGDNLDL